jgi:hypothetical protein
LPASVKPVSLPPTPTPAPTATPGVASKKQLDLNARLRALLPSGPVAPQTYTYHPSVSLNGKLEPTPPPEIVAATKYTFTEKGSGGDAIIKMWVTSVRREGPALICEGWMLRYPYNPESGGPTNGASISIGGGRGRPGTLPPIVEEHASTTCTERELEPFGPSPVPSP